MSDKKYQPTADLQKQARYWRGQENAAREKAKAFEAEVASRTKHTIVLGAEAYAIVQSALDSNCRGTALARLLAHECWSHEVKDVVRVPCQ